MNKQTLLFRNLIFYRRVNLVVIFGMLIAVTVIVGSLAVGDSVKNTLLNLVNLRLGKTTSALIFRENIFEATLAERIAKLAKTKTAPILILNGLATDPHGKYRINQVNVIGINENFAQFSLGKDKHRYPVGPNAVINKATADSLELKPGDDFILRLAKPALLPGDVDLLSEKDKTISLRLTVKAIANDNFPGNFNFKNTQIVPANVFLPLTWLGKKIKQAGTANVIIAQDLDINKLQKSLAKTWTLKDIGLQATQKRNGWLDLKYSKIFIPKKLSNPAFKLEGAKGVLTYFVNSIDLEKDDKILRSTPYSFVAGLPGGMRLNRKLSPNEIVLNTWSAQDLHAKIGDTIVLRFFIPGPMRQLKEEQHKFKLSSIIPIEETDRQLMPDFPGLSNTESCSNWDSSIPIKMDRIRDKDEVYWQKFRGTPKAFINLKTAQNLWGNRFGNLTMIRFSPKIDGKRIEKLRNSLKPSDFGFIFQPVRENAEKSISNGTGGNFSYLFMSLSFFLLFSAFMLTTLLFMLGVESRRGEFAILEAMGFTSCEIRSLFMKEGLILACIGAIIGAPIGLFFNQGILYCLKSVWQGAVGATEISSSVNPWTPFMGAAIGVIIAWISLRISLGKYTNNLQRADEAKTVITEIPGRIKSYLVISIVSLFIGIALIIIGLLSDNPGANPAIFFICGGLLILSDWLCWRYCLEWVKKHNVLAENPSPFRLALKNTSYKPVRSIAAVILLSCGIFLTVAVAINKRTTPNPKDKSSGTGGYTFFIKTSIPVTYDMNKEAGKKKMGLDKELFKDVKFVNMSLSEGNNASCLNLNQVKRPAILGVDFTKFAKPERFTFVGTGSGISKADAWGELASEDGFPTKNGNRGRSPYKKSKAIPAVADQEVIMWSMGKLFNKELPVKDEAGQTKALKFEGELASSIFQGYVLIPETEFHKLFPSVGGSRCLLVAVPAGKEDKVKEALATALMDYGAEITTCSSRLDEFYRVANTYLSIFLILGGLGVLVGTAGFGAIVLRNITERRFELAIMSATGYSKALLRKIVTLEHAILIFAGALSGGITAFVAVIPALYNSAATNPPYLLVTSLFILILVCGIVSVYIAVCFATKGSTLDALRKE